MQVDAERQAGGRCRPPWLERVGRHAVVRCSIAILAGLQPELVEDRQRVLQVDRPVACHVEEVPGVEGVSVAPLLGIGARFALVSAAVAIVS